ncbi:MAG: YfiT family bacillithiol transferase [Chitinophagaceae bacterium]
MTSIDLEDLKYPIGKFVPPTKYTREDIDSWIVDLKHFPQNLELTVQSLDAFQLNTPYRPDGWTVQQLLHHLPDSHMNAYIRFKLGLTELNPTIKPYQENLWANLPDSHSTPVNVSLTLLHALHLRWTNLLIGMDLSDFEKTVFHPERKSNIKLKEMLAMYSWHGQHHLAQISRLKERMNWIN